MDFRLQPVTEPGRRLTPLAEEHADDFATRADEHDRHASFPAENFEAMHGSGLLGACIPAELGGGGLESLHDLAVVMSRIGYGDASTAIAAHMHIVSGWLLARAWRGARGAGDDAQARPLEAFLGMLGSSDVVLCAAATEAGTSPGYPLTEATRIEGGWVLNGRKTFASNSPVATVFAVLARMQTPHGDRIAAAFVPRSSEGLSVVETWDAMGMRASGSHDVVLEDCFVPAPMVLPAGEWGMGDDFGLTFHMAGNLGLLGVFVGIAEAARDLAVASVTSRRKAPSNRTLAERPPIRHTVAGMEIDLAAARAVLERVSTGVDAYFATHLTHQTERHALQLLMKEYVCAKQVVNSKAIDVVDGALTVSGGAGYLTANPLSRLYRDVRAGPFMQAYSPNEAFDYVGRVALGLEPVVDL